MRIAGRIADRTDPDGLPHYAEEAGRLGTVAAVRPLFAASCHTYLVRLDEPHPIVLLASLPLELPVRYYAADELEPIGD